MPDFAQLLRDHPNWAYLILVIGTFFEGETILVIGGYMAHEGLLSLWGVLASAFAGSLSGDQLYFFIGRRHGTRFLSTRPNLQSKVARVYTLLGRWNNVFIVGFRFLYGLRTVSPFVLGTTAVPTLRFVYLNVLGAFIWSLGIGGAGYLFGDVVQRFLRDFKQYEKYVLGGLIVVGLVVSVVLHLRGRGRKAVADAEALAEAEALAAAKAATHASASVDVADPQP